VVSEKKWICYKIVIMLGRRARILRTADVGTSLGRPSLAPVVVRPTARCRHEIGDVVRTRDVFKRNGVPVLTGGRPLQDRVRRVPHIKVIVHPYRIWYPRLRNTPFRIVRPSRSGGTHRTVPARTGVGHHDVENFIISVPP